MTRNLSIYLSRLNYPGIMMLILACVLVGCSAGSTTSTSTPTSHPTFNITGKLIVIHVPTPYSLPGTVIAESDGSLWFPEIAYGNFGTNKSSGAIGHMTSTGTFSAFPLPGLNTYPVQITTGPDGNFWFTAVHGIGQVMHPPGGEPPFFSAWQGEIGMMTHSSKFHMFLLPKANMYPTNIVGGPDGNLWFTVNQPNAVSKIVRMTPSGTFTEFPLTLSTDFLFYITSGPDGNLWFTTLFGNKIGRITPQGSMTFFSLHGYDRGTGPIITGPDGNLWFTANRFIGTLTPKGQVKDFFLPVSNGGMPATAEGITIGPDGALWFTSDNSWVGRITLDGTIKQYSLKSSPAFDTEQYEFPYYLKGIITASDGTFWLTDNDKFGHFV